MNRITDRTMAATGAAFVLLIIVGNTLATAGESGQTHPSGAQVLADVSHHASSASAQVGMFMEMLGFGVQVLWIAYVVTASRQRQAWGLAAAVAGVAGVVELAIKLGSGGAAMVLYADRASLTPELARLLNDLNGAAFVLSWYPFAIFVGAAAWGLYAAGRVGRPLAYSGLAIGVLGVPLALVGATDIVSANPMAFLLALLWTLVVSVRLAVRTQQSHAIRSSADATASSVVPVDA
jgi:hypothetical protein